LLFPYRNKVKMLISVAKIRQVSEFAKLLAEILSEVAKRKKRKPLTSVSYSHLWGTDQRPVTLIHRGLLLHSYRLFSSLSAKEP
jgi:predicted amidophosphoribosyltransferase